MGDTSTLELYSSPSINKPYATTNPTITGFGMSNQSRIINGLPNEKVAGVSTAGSLESLDCLLSATNSNTNTSVEDDGISMIFSDCRNLWNYGANSAVSSGESENNIPMQETKKCIAGWASLMKLFPREDVLGSSQRTHQAKRFRLDKRPGSSNINFQQPSSSVSSSIEEVDPEAIAQMKEMIYRAAAFKASEFGLGSGGEA
ncbi:hypothetical protein GH714_035859 [Hevea brasiliensis]|uniref:Uncharacterized protein n=1 Tax=Hevea brasiliensis TaxID=3981 RepID=A0A6A6NEC2_HEVBR|nr:hypothetical protein GH714_035859 [Hevea brasiliensis]